jgi:SAM-dependent methyltransferase
MSGSRSASLGERYAAHNRDRGRGFVYGGADRIDALRALLDPGATRVLDLGCRDGSLARGLGLPPDRTIGADIDAESLAAARGALAPCRADLWGGFPFRDDAIDLVVAGEILEHVPFPAEFLAEIARVLRPGGRVVGSVPNAFRLKNRLRFLAGRPFETDPTHLRQFSPSGLAAALGAHLAAVRVEPAVGRWVRLWPRLFGVDLVWTAVKPGG